MRFPKSVFLSFLCCVIISGCSTTSEMIRDGEIRLGMSLDDFESTMYWGAISSNDPGMESWGGSGYNQYFEGYLIVYGGDREKVFIFDDSSALVAISGSIEEAQKLILIARASSSKVQNVQADGDLKQQLNRKVERVTMLEERIAAMERQSRAKKSLIEADTQVPLLRINRVFTQDAIGIIEGQVSDNVQVAELKVNGRPIPFKDPGNFLHKEYIPTGGKILIFEVIDSAGLTSTRKLKLERDASIPEAAILFDELNPTARKTQTNINAIALVVGISEYLETSAAEFATRDAQLFYDFARFKLGIPTESIQILLNKKANEVGFLSGINKWLKRSVRAGATDVYIFFAGHGLASNDGNTAYLIPYDGAPDFLERTAISRDEIFSEIASVNPRSVTVFLDTCYSGDARGGGRLVAGRPLRIKVLEEPVPVNFTVLTAAGGDQIAKPLEEARHGLFSYYLMKGMEGDADTNNDNAITAKELHAFVKQNVIQQSGGSQVPELQGNTERVLVRFDD